MRHKLPIFIISAAIICFIVAFFKSYPPSTGTMYYPMFAIVLFLLAVFLFFVCAVIACRWFFDLIGQQRRFHGVAYQPMPGEEEMPSEVAAPGWNPKDLQEAAAEVPPIPATGEPQAILGGVQPDVLAGAETAHEEEIHAHEEELPKEDFKGMVEVPTPPPIAPHEDQSHPNYDHAAGRIIYK